MKQINDWVYMCLTQTEVVSLIKQYIYCQAKVYIYIYIYMAE